MQPPETLLAGLLSCDSSTGAGAPSESVRLLGTMEERQDEKQSIVIDVGVRLA